MNYIFDRYGNVLNIGDRFKVFNLPGEQNIKAFVPCADYDCQCGRSNKSCSRIEIDTPGFSICSGMVQKLKQKVK